MELVNKYLNIQEKKMSKNRVIYVPKDTYSMPFNKADTNLSVVVDYPTMGTMQQTNPERVEHLDEPVHDLTGLRADFISFDEFLRAFFHDDKISTGDINFMRKNRKERRKKESVRRNEENENQYKKGLRHMLESGKKWN